jgi:hypothetical protein
MAANILNNWSQTGDKGRSSSLEVGMGLMSPRHKKQQVRKHYAGPEIPVAGDCEYSNETLNFIKGREFLD